MQMPMPMPLQACAPGYPPACYSQPYMMGGGMGAYPPSYGQGMLSHSQAAQMGAYPQPGAQMQQQPMILMQPNMQGTQMIPMQPVGPPLGYGGYADQQSDSLHGAAAQHPSSLGQAPLPRGGHQWSPHEGGMSQPPIPPEMPHQHGGYSAQQHTTGRGGS